MFILECCHASKSSAAVCETFSNECADKEQPSKTTIDRLVQKVSEYGKCLQQKIRRVLDSLER
jgi:hypothetical protein